MIEPSVRGAWRQLEDRLRPFVARRIHNETDVDDVLQDVYVRVQRGLPSLRDEQKFGAWVYQVARSAIVDHVRATSRQPIPLAEPPELAVPANADDDREGQGEVERYVAFFVATLPSPYREALTLTELEGLTQREAAEVLGISLSGMKSRVQRGRQKLRVALEECCHFALDARNRVMSCEPRADAKMPGDCCE